jgi:hypothetical protein
MKKLFIIIIIFISFQSWTKADDIRDFQIEGMSIGDTLLQFVTNEEIDLSENNSSIMKDKKGKERFIFFWIQYHYKNMKIYK